MTLDKNHASIYINHLKFHIRYAAEKEKIEMAQLLLAMETSLKSRGYIDLDMLRSKTVAVNYQLNK